MLSPQWLDELRARVTLSSVIMRTTKLQRAGREWKACCPFHDEKTPSFTVNDAKGFYHCFGCGAHGDVIRWMTDQRGLAFMDAVKELAAEAGIEVPRANPREAARAVHHASLHDVTTAAQEWFGHNLLSTEGQTAREYMKKRGIGPDLALEFGFGLAPDDRQGLSNALAQFDRSMLIETGLLIKVDDKEPYARFRGRLTLPIHDLRGRIIGFGGRILDSSTSNVPKYLNSPETPLFDKGRTLYNLHRAGPVSRKTHRLVVVEGYMDVIALAGAGIADAVAPLGTALTEAQIELLWRLVDCPVLCFDGDAAGKRAAMRAALRALPLLRPGKSLAFVTLPKGLDPDDLVSQQGAQAMETLLSQPTSLLDTIWQEERDAQPLTTPEQKAEFKARLLEHVENIQQSDIRSLYRRELTERFSAFAFPPRPARNGKQSESNVIPFVRKRNAVTAAQWEVHWQAREKHLYRRLGAAITEGVLRRPSVIVPYLDGLFHLSVDDVDERLLLIAEHVEELGVPESGNLREILELWGHVSPRREDWDNLNFPFVLKNAENERAVESLKMALQLYCKLPSIREARARAQRLCEAEVSDSAFNEQQRLRMLDDSLTGKFHDLFHELMAA